MSLEPTYGVTLPLPTPEVSTAHWASILGVFREHLSCCATSGPSEVPGSLYFLFVILGIESGSLQTLCHQTTTLAPLFFNLIYSCFPYYLPLPCHWVC